jgi:hypothetical protein
MWLVVITHIIHSIAILSDTVGTTAIIGLSQKHPGDWVPLALGNFGLATAYLVASCAATYGLLRPNKGIGFHVLCWMWQQGLLFLGGVSITEAIWIGQYLDGTGSFESGIDISRQHLISDQWPFLAMAAWHFISFWIWRTVTYIRHASHKLAAQVVFDATRS